VKSWKILKAGLRKKAEGSQLCPGMMENHLWFFKTVPTKIDTGNGKRGIEIFNHGLEIFTHSELKLKNEKHNLMLRI